MERVITYIDGFNLYFGLRAKYQKKYLWLNIEELSKALLRNNQSLVGVKYFTSRIIGNPLKVKRQQDYLDAISTLSIVRVFYGQYLINKHICPYCGHIENIPSEKMTDVNIATQMLNDAYKNNYDVAILISGDSDLSGTINEIRSSISGKKLVVAFPPDRTSFALKKVANGYFTIGRSLFSKSQFPNIVIGVNGYKLNRPISWK